MRPRVFLSHSKKDKEMILKIAKDLQMARIDVWYDEWEIPPGESIRKKIFEDGIPNCDIFFVYLTPNSIDSYWVQKELDAAVIYESEQKNSYISLFCDSEGTRKKLSLDLKAMNIPALNTEEYYDPLIKLIAKTFEISSKNQKQNFNKDSEITTLKLKNEILEQKNIIKELTKGVSFDEIIDKFKTIKFDFNKNEKSLIEILKDISLILADGAQYGLLSRGISKSFGVQDDKLNNFTNKYSLSDITGNLLIYGIIEIKPETENTSQIYYLSNMGKELVRKLI